MSESEARRQRLLNSTRSLYSDKGTVPAIHPRYKGIYSNLYEDTDDDIPKSTFGIRLFICVLIFALFVAADYKDSSVLSVSSKRIVDEITYELNIKSLWDNL